MPDFSDSIKTQHNGNQKDNAGKTEGSAPLSGKLHGGGCHGIKNLEKSQRVKKACNF